MKFSLSPRIFAILVIFMILFGLSLTFSAAANASHENNLEQQDPLLYHKSALGLMPPAYGASAGQRTALTRPASPDAGLFQPFVVYPSGSWPEAVAAGEFTGDSRLDASLSTSFDWNPANDNRLHFFAQTAGGTLTHTLALAAGSSPIALASGDFNRDGRSDLAVVNQDQNALSIFLQQPGGAWAPRVTYPTGASPDGLAVGDFNGDLRQDIAVSHAISQCVGLYYQQADGTFAAPVYFGLSSGGFNDMAAGDLNGDGYADLAVLRGAGHHTAQVAVFYQQNHTFGAPVFLTAQDGGFLANGLAVGDVTGDGRDDVVVTAGGNTPNAFLNVFVQQSNGTLATTPVVYPAFHLPEAVRIGDVNHDGRNDVVVVHAAWLSLTVYLQQAGGTLAAYERYPLPYRDYYHPDSLALADVTGDGALDVLIANHSSLPAENGLVVLANTGDAPTSRFTTPAAATYITTTVSTLHGTASTASGTLDISTNGGRTWNAQPAALNWSYTWNVPGTDGSYTLLSRVTDATGRVQSPPGQSQVIVDHTRPLGSLVVNGEAPYTNNPAVSLGVSGSDFNGVALMRFANPDGTASSWVNYAGTYNWTLTGGDGLITVTGLVRDTPGNNSLPFSDAIILDTHPPSCAISINNDAVYTNSVQTRLSLVSTDANPVAEMRLRNAGGAWPAWQAYTTSLPWNIGSGDGTHSVEAQFRDIAGNPSSICSDSIILDTTPPTCSILLNNNATYTNQRPVTLNLSSTDANGVAFMSFSFDPTWRAYATTYNQTLPNVDGSYTTSARFMDVAGNVSSACSDSIILDMTPPTGSVVINSGAAYTASPVVSLATSASDTNGVAQMRFSNDGTTWAAWRTYASSTSWTLSNGDGTKTVLAQYQDNAINPSGSFTDTIILDTTPPTCGIKINNNAVYATTPQVSLALSSTDANNYIEMRVRNASGSWTAWQPYASSLAWDLGSGDGPDRVYAQFKDIVGNATAACSDTIILDTTPPACNISVNNGAAYTNQSAATLTLNSSDTNGLNRMRFSNDGVTWAAWTAYATTFPWTLPTPDGVKPVSAQFEDKAGNDSPACADSIIFDTTAPSGFVVINGGALYTAVPTTTLTLGASDTYGVNQMRISNDGISWGSWQAYAISLAWVLPGVDGPKTVYVQYMDNAGNPSVSTTDSIILDTTPPGGAVLINQGVTYTRYPTVTLSITATDEIPVTQMRVGHNGLDWLPWEAYQSSRTWVLSPGDGFKTVYVQFRDAVNNISQPVADAIILDTTPPSCSILINGGTPYTNQAAVNLDLASSDSNGVTQMQFSNDGITWAAWQAYGPSSAWTLNPTDGLQSVYARFEDSAGNSSSDCQDNITLDTTAPIGFVLINDGDPYTGNSAVGLALGATDTNGVLQMHLSNDGSGWSEWLSYSTSAAWSLPAGDGNKTIYVQYQDRAGNISASVTDSIILDTTPPDGSIAIDGGAAYTRVPTVTLTLIATDLIPVSDMQFSNDGAAWGDWEAYQTSRAWTLVSGDGTHTVYVHFRDAVGNVSLPIQDTIISDTTPPVCQLFIEGGASYTTQVTVTLNVACSDANPPIQVSYSNDGATWSNWETYSALKTWSLNPGDGPQTVYLKAQDAPGNAGTPVSNTIILDTTAPLCSIAINNNDPFTISPFTTLGLSCQDANGLEAIRLSSDSLNWGSWQPYITTLAWTLPVSDGLKTVYLQARDLPGNVSNTFSDTIVLDTTPPEGGCAVSGANGYTATPLVDLTFWKFDANDVPVMQVRNAATPWGQWITYTHNVSWTLPGVDGEKAVNCRYQDTPGNVSSIYTATVVLDTTSPSCQLAINNGQEYLKDVLVTLNITSTDIYTTSAMQFSNDGTNWSAWEPYGHSKGWEITTGDGLKTVWAQVHDLAGNLQQCRAQAVRDTAAPTGTILLDHGALYTTMLPITVTLDASDATSGVDQVCLGGSPSCTAWQPYAPTLAWLLSDAEGEQAVYAQFRDYAGNISQVYSDTIILDRNAPVGSITINGGASLTKWITVTLTLNAEDLSSGVCYVQMRNAGTDWGDWIAYKTELPWQLQTGGGERVVEVLFRDCAGNTSQIFRDSIWLAPYSLYMPLIQK